MYKTGCIKDGGKRKMVRLWKYYRNPDRNAWISFLPHLLRVLLIERRILPGIMVVDKEGEVLRCKIGPTFYQKIMLHIE
jgi:ribosomal protein L24E